VVFHRESGRGYGGGGLRAFGVPVVTGDRVGGDWVRKDLERHGVQMDQTAPPKANLYLALLAAINRRGVDIPDNPTLTRQLRLLERRARPSGRDWVDLPRGQSEDEANAVAGLVWLLTAEEKEEPFASIWV